MRGEIKLVLEGASLQDTERIKRIIDRLFVGGVFNITGGKAILNFDNHSELLSIMKEIYTRFDKRDDEESFLQKHKPEIILETIK